MKSPRLRSLSAESMPGLPDEVGPLVDQVSSFMSDTGLAFDELIRQQSDPGFVLKKVTFTAPGDLWRSISVYTNGWSEYGDPTYAPDGYFIDHNGYVYLRGLIAPGTLNTIAFTLPVGYRPGKRMLFTGESDAGYTRIDVTTNGEVVPSVNGTTWVSLDGIVYKATSPWAAPDAPSTGGWPIPVAHGFSVVEGVECIKAVCQDNPGDLVGAPKFDWAESTRGKLVLKNVYGAVAGRSYEVTLKIYGS